MHASTSAGSGYGVCAILTALQVLQRLIASIRQVLRSARHAKHPTLSLTALVHRVQARRIAICSSTGDAFFDSRPTPSDPEPAGNAEPSQGSPSSGPMPEWKWWTGLCSYAATNVGFMWLFDVCAGCPDIKQVLTYMAIYYAIALAARFVLRKVLGIGPDFPQFFWEGFPKRS